MKSLFSFLAQQVIVPNAVNPAYFSVHCFLDRRLNVFSMSLAEASWRFVTIVRNAKSPLTGLIVFFGIKHIRKSTQSVFLTLF